VVDSPAYHDILTDEQAVVIKGKRTTPVLLVRRLVVVQPVRVLHTLSPKDQPIVPMRTRLITLACLLALCVSTCISVFPSHAQSDGTDRKNYRSAALGVAFDYPVEWEVRETPQTGTVIAASPADLTAIASGITPVGLIFTLTMTTMRQIGAGTPADFYAVLGRMGAAGTAGETEINQARGVLADTQNSTTGIAGRVLILSVGQRRVALVRGFSTPLNWTEGTASAFDAITATLTFFTPDGKDLDRIGTPLWNLEPPNLTRLTDVSLSANGGTIFVSDAEKGIWTLNPAGETLSIDRPSAISTFGGFAVLANNTRYVADPTSHTIWRIRGNDVQRLAGGREGTQRGAFGAGHPRLIAFPEELIYALDETENGVRIQIFNRTGQALTAWELDRILGYRIDAPIMTADSGGYAYIVGRNTNGIAILNPNGSILRQNIAAAALAGVEVTAITVDRFVNFYVATRDQGVFRLNSDGLLQGVIGEPYDGASPPKLGQLAKPVALVLAGDSALLYVVDAEPYPQVVSFSLNGDRALDLKSGTREGGAIAPGARVLGAITPSAFVWEYHFEGQRGQIITITMSALDSTLDPYLALLNFEGKPLFGIDDTRAADLGRFDARIAEYRLPYTGSYRIQATRFGREAATSRGEFELTFEVAK